MGKNLKGKECGKGIYQRKDGLYSARYYAKTANAKRNTLKHCQKRKTGLLTQDMKNGIILLPLLPI